MQSFTSVRSTQRVPRRASRSLAVSRRSEKRCTRRRRRRRRPQRAPVLAIVAGPTRVTRGLISPGGELFTPCPALAVAGLSWHTALAGPRPGVRLGYAAKCQWPGACVSGSTLAIVLRPSRPHGRAETALARSAPPPSPVHSALCPPMASPEVHAAPRSASAPWRMAVGSVRLPGGPAWS